MTIRTRRWFFYGLLVVFLVLGTFVTLYAQGFRLNLTTLQINSAGGIFIRSYPDDAQIFLNKKQIQNQSAFLSRGTFISGLIPKNYDIQLKASGYDAWEETAYVKPSLVSEFKYAVLIPQNATTVATSENVQTFFENGGNILTVNASGTIMWRDKAIMQGSIISHSTDFKDAVLQSKNGVYILYDFTNAASTNLNTILIAAGIAPKNISIIKIDPYDNTRVLVETPSRIVAIDLTSDTVIPIATMVPENTLSGVASGTLGISPSLFAWAVYNGAAHTSQIAVYDKFSGNVTDDSLNVSGTIQQLTWIQGNLLGVLESNGSLYRYNTSQESLTKIADDVKSFYPNADGTMVAALENHSLEIFSLTTADYYRFNLPQITNVQNLMWYKDDNHLFVTYPDHVAFLDFTDTALRNFTTISEGTAPFYDTQTNSLYIVDSGQKLLRFDIPE